MRHTGSHALSTAASKVLSKKQPGLPAQAIKSQAIAWSDSVRLRCIAHTLGFTRLFERFPMVCCHKQASKPSQAAQEYTGTQRGI